MKLLRDVFGKPLKIHLGPNKRPHVDSIEVNSWDNIRSNTYCTATSAAACCTSWCDSHFFLIASISCKNTLGLGSQDKTRLPVTLEVICRHHFSKVMCVDIMFRLDSTNLQSLVDAHIIIQFSLILGFICTIMKFLWINDSYLFAFVYICYRFIISMNSIPHNLFSVSSFLYVGSI